MTFSTKCTTLNLIRINWFNDHITITNSDFRFMVAEQLHGIGIDPGAIILEPEGKNTTPI